MNSRLLAGLALGVVLFPTVLMTRGIVPWLGIGLVSGVLLILALRRGGLQQFRRSEQPTADTSLEALKRQYVEGSITQAEYEQRLETLFKTETVADVEEDRPDDADRASAGEVIDESGPPQPTSRNAAPDGRCPGKPGRGRPPRRGCK